MLPLKGVFRVGIELHISIIRGMMDYDYRDVPTQKHPMDMALYMRQIARSVESYFGSSPAHRHA